MLTVGASLLSDSLLRVTISPAAPLPSRLGFCVTALQLATSNNVPQAQPLSHRPP